VGRCRPHVARSRACCRALEAEGTAKEGTAKWDARSRGGYLGHWIFFQLIKIFGPSISSLVLYPVVAFYTLIVHKERAASTQYLERVLGPTHLLGRWARSYRHLLSFARSYLDGAMLGVLGKEIFSFESHGAEHIRNLAEAGKGGVMLTAHLGTWELSSGMLKDKHGVARVAIVMFRSDAEQLQGFIESLHGKRPRVIAVGEGDLGALEILRAVRGGELVAMQGDRTVDLRDVRVPFFGRDARWPVGPWIIAALSGSPILCSFALRVGPRKYKFVAYPPMTVRFAPGRSKDEQLKEWISTYVARVEEVLREYPYQWFNFFDFWAAEPKVPAASSTAGGAQLPGPSTPPL
jgi:predicted LPLAT superfamily acyltransferase